jgi:succinoglycan biosynthesis protein ExoA
MTAAADILPTSDIRTASDTLIVVPCLNEEKSLPGLLEWLRRESGIALVVVADGGSSDASRSIVEAAMCEWPSLRLIENPERYQSAGINRAVQAFGEGREWLVRIDAHAAYPEKYVQTLIDAAMRHDAQSVVVPMVTSGSGCFQHAVAAAQNSKLGTGGSLHRHIGNGAFVDHGHHALMRLSSFTAVDGYDATFSHNEDAELDFRLGEKGNKIWLEPKAAVRYFPRSTATALWRQYFNFGKGRARTVRKHRLRLKLRQALPLAIAPVVLVGLLALPGFLLWPWAALLVAPMAGWMALCQAAGVVLAIGERSRCTLAAGSALMIMHAAWSFGFWSQIVSPAKNDY